MKTSKTRKNGFRTRIIATVLSATMIFSVGAMTARLTATTPLSLKRTS